MSGPPGPSGSSAHIETMAWDKSLNLSDPLVSHVSNGPSSHFLPVCPL